MERLFDFFDARLDHEQSTRRTLNNTLEGERLCIALKAQQQASAQDFLQTLGKAD